MITKQNSIAAAQATQFEQQVVDGLAEIYKNFPNLVACDANSRTITKACAEYLGQEVVPTVGVFGMVLADNPDLWQSLAMSTEAQQKTQVLREIKGLLQSVRTPLELKSEIKKLGYFTLAELIERRNQIQERRRLSQLSSTAIREELAANRPQQHKYVGYQLLPPPNELPASELVRILKCGAAREYLRKFSSEQLNDRLFGRS